MNARLYLGLVLILLGLCGPALAGAQDPLFINLTSDDPHRASMAIGFGKNQLERGHPLTLFLNDKAVAIASTTNAQGYAGQQAQLAEILKHGAVVYVCPMCMKHYKVQEAELMPGLRVSNPDLTEAALFADKTKTLSW